MLYVLHIIVFLIFFYYYINRWVTNLRARWNINPNAQETQHFVIGNMKQTVDIYSGETGEEIVQLYDENHITAISGVCQFHPSTTQPMVLAGNASGRMVCWDSSATKE